jgi:hypothetical protein
MLGQVATKLQEGQEGRARIGERKMLALTMFLAFGVFSE